jgi:hypothetical protein
MRMMLWRASEVVLMSETSSKVSQGLVWIFGGIEGISEHNGFMGEAVGDWGGGEGVQNEMGRLGLGARQLGLSEHFGFWSLWGGESLQLLEPLDLG